MTLKVESANTQAAPAANRAAIVAASQGLNAVAAALLKASAVLAACALLGLKLPLPRVGADNLDPRSGWNPPDTAIDIEPRSGPVVVTVEFRIRETDVTEFLKAMAERRRVRRRAGARRWTLLRDVSDPEAWIERFHVPNWIEYIRHNSRITEADALLTGRAWELHAGPEPPRVRRLIERQTGIRAGTGLPDLSEPLTDARRFG